MYYAFTKGYDLDMIWAFPPKVHLPEAWCPYGGSGVVEHSIEWKVTKP